jgi:N6-L-threonylcarbamoyladenine synthase
MKILAIDTSCDETSVAITESDCILANVLSSQIQTHQEWGGVVPSLAKRKHQELIDLVINTALKRAKLTFEDIDVFAVTKGPGLAIALEVGIEKTKELATKYKKPVVAVNHMEGHLYSTLAKNAKGNPKISYKFPLLGLLISGGHTELVLMRDHGQYEIMGQTLDDALGEAYDKVGRMLNMGYPAGPVLEKIAENGDKNKYILPVPMKHSKDANMSYSGLKTASVKLINDELKISSEALKTKDYKMSSGKLDSKTARIIVQDISASFQKAAVEQVLLKTDFTLNNLLKDLEIKDLIIGGGVAQNKYLRKEFRKKFGKNLRIHYPKSKKLYTDNAGMIAVAAYFNFINKKVVKSVGDLD